MKKIILILSLLGFISISFLIYQNFKPKPNPDQLPLDINLIQDLTINNLIIDGQTYHYNQGKITSENNQSIPNPIKQKINQLVFFYITVKEDPLFTSPDLNAEELKKSIDLLKFTQDKYNQVAKAQRKLFPIPFLEKIPQISKIEADFLQSPSDFLANQLSSLYEETALAYQEEINQFILAVQDSQKEGKMGGFMFILSSTTPDIIQSDLSKISQNAASLAKEAQKRDRCLKSGLGCYRPKTDFPQKFIETNLATPSFKLLDKEVLFTGSVSDRENNTRGPYVVSTSCFGWQDSFTEKNQPFYTTLRTNKIMNQGDYKNFPFLEFKLATQNFYSKVARDSWEADYSKSLDRVFQLETTNYMCTNLELQPKVAALDYFLTNFKDQPIISKINLQNQDELKKMSDFEINFLSSQMPTEQALNQLAYYYAYLYTAVDDQTIKDELLKRYLIINRKLSNFPLIANRAADSLARVILEEEKKPGFSLQKNMLSYIYFFRSSWNILYFPYSPSFWRDNQKLDYLEKRQVEESSSSGHFLNYKQMLEKYTPEEIKRIHEASAKYNTQPLLY